MDALKQLFTYVLSLIIIVVFPSFKECFFVWKYTICGQITIQAYEKEYEGFFTGFDSILQELTCTYSITAYKHAYKQRLEQ